MIPTVLFILQRSGGYLAGAKVDWISQHAVFPEYFRELFYKTGTVFPQFAAEIGGGQNIYNYAYYGLCNPLYWISYLLPFVKMTDYIQVLSLVSEMANGVLCYLWLGRHFEGRAGHAAYAAKYSFLGALVLVLALPVTYHSSAQIMFVSYMPFLILTFIGWDRYCRTSKYGLMTCSIVMMILISFYFAVGALAALVLYGFSGWKREQASSFSVFVKSVWHQFYPVLLGGFLSMFYLFPVYCAMRQGRSGRTTVSMAELIMPDVSLHKLLYSPYGLGVAAMAVIAVCTSLFYQKCREKWLGLMLAAAIVFPLFSWILNGGLYVRDKALIPLLPLICFVFTGFIKRLGDRKLDGIRPWAGYVLAAVVLLAGAGDATAYERRALYLELAVCGAVLFISIKGKALCCQTAGLTAAAGMLVLCLVQLGEAKDGLVTEQFAEALDNQKTVQTAERILEEDKSLYRMEVRGDSEYNKANQNRVLAAGQNLTTSYSSVNNSYYHSFRQELGLSKSTRNSLMEDMVDNPVFLRFMGVKYLIGQSGTVSINEEAAPIFYLTDQTITEEQFAQLPWPQKQLALLEHAVAGKKDGTITVRTEKAEALFGECAKEQNADPEAKGPLFSAVGGEGTLTVQSSEAVTKTIALSKAADQDTYLFLSFSMNNLERYKDVSVSVNGQKNKLSGAARVYYNANEVFHYTCAVSAGTTEIEVEFGPGHYQISDIQCVFGKEDRAKNESLYQNELRFTKSKQGNGYSGEYEAEADSWLITSIPYDKNFRVYVDGRKVQNQRVNKAFLGARITEGRHDIRIIYKAPGRTAGFCLTAVTAAAVCWRISSGKEGRKMKTFMLKYKTMLSYLFFGVFSQAIRI